MTQEQQDKYFDKYLEELKESYKNNKLVPVIGAGFSLNILNDDCKPPLWKKLTEQLKEEIDCRSQQSRIEIALKAEDYITALTWIHHCDNPKFKSCISNIFKKSNRVTKEELPVHSDLMAIGFNLVMTTNFDSFLEKTTTAAKTKDYSSPNIKKDIERIDSLQSSNQNQIIYHIIYHIHGLPEYEVIYEGRTVLIKRTALLTWQEYFSVYGINKAERKLLIQQLVEESSSGLNKIEKTQYSDLLKSTFKEAWRKISIDRRRIEGNLTTDIISGLLSRKNLLFIGFSVKDPFWKLIIAKSLVKSGGDVDWNHYYLSTQPEGIDLSGFKPIVVDYKNNDQAFSQFFKQLASRIHTDESISGYTGEKRNREKKYGFLLKQYPDLSWIYKDDNGLIPFTELWHNDSTRTDIKAIPAIEKKRQWNLPKNLSNLLEEYWNYHLEQDKKINRKTTNEIKVRVNNFHVDKNKNLVLDVEPIEYKNYLFTNHFVANIDLNELPKIKDNNPEIGKKLEDALSVNREFSPRSIFCGNKDSIKLSPQAYCSNHLGVTSLLLGNYDVDSQNLPVIICPPSTNQISSPRDIIPMASGSVDWPILPDAFEKKDVYSIEDVEKDLDLLNFARQLRREFIEECLSYEKIANINESDRLGSKYKRILNNADRETFDIVNNHILLSFCQNIERGGKPELFYLMTLSISANRFLKEKFDPNWELHNLQTPIISLDDIYDPQISPGLNTLLLLPSPINNQLEIHDSFEKAINTLAIIIKNNGYNPVLRTNLASLVLYVSRNYDSDVREYIKQELPGLINSHDHL